MSIPVFSREALVEASQKEEIVKLVAQQIIKDFSEFGLEIDFSGEAGRFYQELFGQMQAHVTRLLSDDYALFLSLLYRIDVSNQEVQYYETQMPGVSYDAVLTELIIHRELKKVLYRKFYDPSANASTNSIEEGDE